VAEDDIKIVVGLAHVGPVDRGRRVAVLERFDLRPGLAAGAHDGAADLLREQLAQPIRRHGVLLGGAGRTPPGPRGAGVETAAVAWVVGVRKTASAYPCHEVGKPKRENPEVVRKSGNW